MTVSLSLTDAQTDRFEQKWPSLAASILTPVHLARCDFSIAASGDFDAVHVQRPQHADIHNINIIGKYRHGVTIHFGLYANLRNISVSGGAKKGFWIGYGGPVWADATVSNSASNQASLHQCRFHGTNVTDVGFELEGADNVFFSNCTVEGHECGVGWSIKPRAARGTCRLQDCWLETVGGAKTGIIWDGYKGKLIIDNFNMKHLPDVLLDTRGDQGSTIVLQNNTWSSVPPIKLDKSTDIEFGAGNSFSRREFYDAVI